MMIDHPKIRIGYNIKQGGYLLLAIEFSIRPPAVRPRFPPLATVSIV
jgi:hypothetical protein